MIFSGDPQPLGGSIARTLENIAKRWQGADAQVLRPAFSLLALGRPLAPDDIAGSLSLAVERVRAALRYRTIGTDASGHLVELFGFMLQPSWHRVDIEGRSMFACCALVAHTIPVLTEEPVRIVSVDPLSRGVVEIAVDRDGISSVKPREARATLPVSEGPWPAENVARHFCSHTRHFPTRDRAEAFATKDPRRRVLELDVFHGHAVEISERIFGDAPLPSQAQHRTVT